MNSGAVKWRVPSRGLGFIKPDAGGVDVFVHATALQHAGVSDLKDGQRVRFNVFQNKNGETAAGDLVLSE